MRGVSFLGRSFRSAGCRCNRISMMAREKILSVIGLSVVAVIVVIAFRAYLHPDFIINLGNMLWFCM